MNYLTSFILPAILVLVTGWYAFSTHKILKEMNQQSLTLSRTAKILALTALMNAAGHPTGEQPIPKLRAILKEFDIDLPELKVTDKK